MKRNYDITGIQYMRAHGNSPGPTHRPRLTGLISGVLASVGCLAIAYVTAALAAESSDLQFGYAMTATLDFAALAVAGVIYAEIFKRAANDRSGGWLFGASYGFLLWMIGPVVLWRLIAGEPMAHGMAAMGLFAAHVVYGTVLGGVYPYINRLLLGKLK
jgi:hypothetical protein